MPLDPLVDIGVVALPVLYGAVVAAYAAFFFELHPAAPRVASRLLVSTVVLHALYLLARTAAFDHPPVTTVYEIMTMLAFCIAAAYTYLEFRTGSRTTGFFILILAFVFQAVSSIFIRDLLDIPAILRSRLLGFHVTAALLGYTGISLSAAYGFLYLMLYHEIKSSRFGLVYSRLPNLEMLEKMSHKAEVFGFILLTVAIAVGMVWLPRAFPDFSYLDPKLVGSLAIWVLYAVGLTAKKVFGWQGRKMMILTLVAFGFVFLSMTLINMVMSGFHTFR